MSKVTYLLGAGASYGQREFDDKGRIVEFVRGLPVVNELSRAISLLQSGGTGKGVHFPAQEAARQNVSLANYEYVQKYLNLLRVACASFPTIDTLAKLLYVTKQAFVFKDKNVSVGYEDLKRMLTAALLMMQSEKNKDLRYDGFIASLIDSRLNFPPMTILSWNYDVQLELAYSGYSLDGRYLPTFWDELNVYNKTYLTDFDVNKPFAMIKLNGTACFTNQDSEKWLVGTKYIERISDCFYGGENKTPYQYGYDYLSGANYHTMLSYAWETGNMESLKNIVLKRTSDTAELIVIGYSFPYVNNEVDSYILQHMWKLQKIVIQDKEDSFNDIKERIEGILEPTGRQVEIVSKSNLQQFYIPNRFL